MIYCTGCWKDRPITTNGKCLYCGAKLPRPKHWDLTLKKLKLIVENDEMTPLEIKGYIYFLTIDYLDKFKKLDIKDFRTVGEFMSDVKENCPNFRIALH